MNPRELLQSAQAAEREGDLARAVALLEQAAGVYEETGHPGRAAQMRRHIDRLLPGSSRGELPAVASPLDSEPQWDLGPGLVEKAPTLADPALGAWCSFCCRPTREVGALVAGPAQAFICRACIALAMGLLGTESVDRQGRTAPVEPARMAQGSAPPDRREPSVRLVPTDRSDPVAPEPEMQSVVATASQVPWALEPDAGRESSAGATARMTGAVLAPAVLHAEPVPLALPRRLSGRGLEALRTQRGAVQRIEDALAAGHARVLLVGAMGSGKSTWLRHWAERGLGKAWEGAGPLPEGGAVLVDDVDRLEAPARRMLARALPSRSVVLALDATLPAPGKEIDGRRVHGSEEVDSVAGDWLPGSVLDGLTLETFEAPGSEELRTLADRWRAPDGSGATREAREEALRAAETSPRRAHALHALLLRWWASR